MRTILARLELFECIGLIASIAATWVFVHFASALDKLERVPGYHWHMVTVVAIIYGHFIPYAVGFAALVFLMMRWRLRKSKAVLWRNFAFGLRLFLAYCLLLIVFRVVNFYVPVLHPGIRDAAIQQIDRVLLGGRLISEWMEPLVHPWLSAVLTGAYVSWFWLLFATLLLLVVRSREIASEYVLASLLAFYVGYICYILVPVIGPGYTVHYAVHIGDIAPQFTMDRQTIARDCFPSLHTALSVLMAIYVWRHQRAWRIPYTVVVGLIIFATLYLRFHYLLDDLAGAALAVAVSYVAPALHGSWSNLRHRESSARGSSVQ